MDPSYIAMRLDVSSFNEPPANSLVTHRLRIVEVDGEEVDVEIDGALFRFEVGKPMFLHYVRLPSA